MKDPHFYIVHQPWANKIELYFRGYTENGARCTALPIHIHVIQPEEGMMQQDPFMSFPEEEGLAALQSLMDQLWVAGIRPKNIGTAGHLAATQEHLADMRAIVANKLQVKLPGV